MDVRGGQRPMRVSSSITLLLTFVVVVVVFIENSYFTELGD